MGYMARQGRWAALGILALAGGIGCAAAAAGAAGAGAGIYLTNQGAKSIVNGSVSQVTTRARSVLESEGVTLDATKMEESGKERELKGKKGDLDITVSMKKETSTTTSTEVSARKNLVEWDKDYAKEILNRIVTGSPEGAARTRARTGVDSAAVDTVVADSSAGRVKIINRDTTGRDSTRRDSVPR